MTKWGGQEVIRWGWGVRSTFNAQVEGAGTRGLAASPSTFGIVLGLEGEAALSRLYDEAGCLPSEEPKARHSE
jgi:hypothetical protein